ncbi:MAG: hypothetical protein H7301_04135 [Cryobacterium sp.]|nr:hypothetical protein [Oligoflexia bacterium]
MTKSTIALALLVLLSTPAPSYAARCVELLAHSNGFPAAAEIDEHLFAVHLTQYLPTDGVIHAVSKDRHRLGATLHFSLGGPVEDHSFGSWEKSKYAVMVPFKKLTPQLLNILPHDTFILGSFVLPEDAIVFIPESEPTPPNLSTHIIRYPDSKDLRDVVRETIRSKSGIPFVQTGSHFSSEVSYHGVNLLAHGRVRDFFSQTLDRAPSITTLEHYESFSGIIDGSVIEVFSCINNGAPFERRLQNLNSKLLQLKDALSELDRVSCQMPLSQMATKSVQEGKREASRTVRILETEVFLQEKFGKSLLGTDLSTLPEIRKKILDLSLADGELEKWAASSLSLFREVKSSQKQMFAEDYRWIFRYSDMAKFTSRIEKDFPGVDPRKDPVIRQAVLGHALDLLWDGRLDSKTVYEELRRSETILDSFVLKSKLLMPLILAVAHHDATPSLLAFFKHPGVTDHFVRNLKIEEHVFEQDFSDFRAALVIY